MTQDPGQPPPTYSQQPNHYGPPAGPAPTAKTPLWRRGWVLAVGGLIVGLVIGSLAAGGSSSTSDARGGGETTVTVTAEAAAPPASATEAPTTATSAAAKTHTIVYAVTGQGSATTISYLSIANGSAGQEQANGEALPWSKTIKVPAGQVFDYGSFSLTAQSSGSDGIGCAITVDGVQKAKQSSSGAYAVVTCLAQQ